MNKEEVRQLLYAMECEKNGLWHAAHSTVQDISSDEGSWVHGYLHRVEGDLPNAAYWYRWLEKECPDNPLEKEAALIIEHLRSLL